MVCIFIIIPYETEIFNRRGRRECRMSKYECRMSNVKLFTLFVIRTSHSGIRNSTFPAFFAVDFLSFMFIYSRKDEKLPIFQLIFE